MAAEVIPYYQWGGGGHRAVRPLEKAIKIVPLARLMVYVYCFLFYGRNSIKMSHSSEFSRDDGPRRSPRCPPAHPLVASPSHPAQASARTARPSGPSTRSTASMGKVSPLFNPWGGSTAAPPMPLAPVISSSYTPSENSSRDGGGQATGGGSPA